MLQRAMSSLTLLLLLLLLVSSVTADTSINQLGHFGASMTFTPKGKDSTGKYEVVIRIMQAHYTCNQDDYICDSGDCGSQISAVTRTVSEKPSDLKWCQQETVMTRQLPNNNPFVIKYPKASLLTTGQGFWFKNIFSDMKQWEMRSRVDLGTRSDTGEANRSPITTTIPIIRIVKGCPSKINLTVFDPDGDQVRCRYAEFGMGECQLCKQPAYFSLDQDSCTISYSIKNSQPGLHPFELMFEDFPRKTITNSYSDGTSSTKKRLNSVNSNEDATTIALSRLPLQFSIQVDSSYTSSCVDGVWSPKFLPPTPSNGERQTVSLNNTHQIKVNGSSSSLMIDDLIISGPEGIIKEKKSRKEYTLEWTPTKNDLNQHFPICFLLEAISSSGVYHSEMRCVIVSVVPPPALVETTVNCNDAKIKVEVKKSDVIKRNEAKLHLKSSSDPDCKLSKHSNSTHLVAVMSLNTCGTTLEEDGDNLIFKNEITSANTTQTISRKEEVEIVFSCAYPKRTNLTVKGFKHKNPYAFTEKGFGGAFSFQFEFFESQQFTTLKDPSTYPLEVKLKEMIFIEIEANTSIPNTELFVESCKATPLDNPNSAVSYTIIENGCKKDNTVQIYSSPKSKFRFGMETFEFIGDYQEVYITCSVILCKMGVSGTRCSQGCISGNSGNSRRRREAIAQTARHSISQGPLHLITTSDGQASHPSLNLGMNVIFIVGCLLVSGALIYRLRKSKVKYQPLPNPDFN